MKKFFTALTVALVVVISAHCSAADYRPVSVTYLKSIIGNWYDAKGNLVLSISNDYKINGCTVMSVDYVADMVGMYKVKVDEGNRYRTIELMYGESQNSSDHEILMLNHGSNNEIALRKTKEPRYFESVGGIYLGMGKDEVLKLYGQPSRIENKIIWKYNKEGFDVRIWGGVVFSITIYKNGNRRFDWSGLSANSSKADFAYKYNSEVDHRGSIRIGHGEVIRIYKDSVLLEIILPGGI